MNTVIVIESHGTGFMHECHKADCQDVTKKNKLNDFQGYTASSIAEAKELYEEDNETFEAEGGPGNGYYWADHVKVYPCATEKAGA